MKLSPPISPFDATGGLEGSNVLPPLPRRRGRLQALLHRYRMILLVIGLPMTTAADNADNPFAIPVGAAAGKRASKASYVLGHQPKSIDWRARHAKPHPMKRLPEGAFREACAVLNQIVALA